MVREDDSPDEGLQAVMIADSFTLTFRPITLSPKTPRVLCPLNNVTLLDYSIEWLAGSGVEELILFCVSGHAEISSHIRNRNLNSTTTTGMKVTVIEDPNCSNAGDALRELDRRDLIKSDPFILLQGGDIVTNVDIAPALELHKQRKAKDPSAMMTLLLKSVQQGRSTGNQASIRSTLDDLIVGIDMSKNDPNRIVLFDSHPRRHSTKIPCSFFTSHSNVTVRTDLLDTGIDICSPDVLARFSDEFDYRHVRKQFLANSVAEEEEGLQNKIYAHLIGQKEYAGRVLDLRTYHQISRDLLKRWVYPVVPDNLPSGYEGKFRYVLNRHFVYREVKASMGKSSLDKGIMTKIARKSKIGKCTMLGAHIHIGEGCEVENTVVGHECSIHTNAKVIGSHLWNNVSIHSGAEITSSVLCENVIIHSGAKIGKGCVIGHGCIIGENIELPPYTRITLEEDHDDDDGFSDDGFGDSSSSSSSTSGSSSSGSSDGDNDTSGSDSDSDESVKDEKVELTLDKDTTENKIKIASDHDVVGKDGIGRVWKPSKHLFSQDDDPDADSDYDDDSSDEENDDSSYDDLGVELLSNNDISTPIERMHSQSIGYDTTNLYQKRYRVQKQEALEEEAALFAVDDEEEDMSDFDDHNGVMSTTYGVGNNFDEDGLIIQGRSKGVDVVKVLKDICLEHDVNSPIENLMIEINGYKFSQNATFSDCVMGAMLCVITRLGLKKGVCTPTSLMQDLSKELEHWKSLFSKMCLSIEEEKSILMVCETAATEDENEDVRSVLCAEPSFRIVLQTLYDKNIVTEEAILQWGAERKEDFEDDDGDHAHNEIEKKKKDLFFQGATQSFLTWLDEDSDSEDGSSSGSDESESE